jgi:hypothetical protein
VIYEPYPVYTSVPQTVVVEQPVVIGQSVTAQPSYIDYPTSYPTSVVGQDAYAAGAQPASGLPAGELNVIFDGLISRDDDVAAKEVLTVDGISVKVEDTDGHPLDADLDIRVGHHDFDYEDVGIGSRIEVIGRSGQLFLLEVIDIDDRTETVRFILLQ